MYKKMFKNNEINSLPTSIAMNWSFTLLLYCPYVIYDLPVAVLSARLQQSSNLFPLYLQKWTILR